MVGDHSKTTFLILSHFLFSPLPSIASSLALNTLLVSTLKNLQGVFYCYKGAYILLNNFWRESLTTPLCSGFLHWLNLSWLEQLDSPGHQKDKNHELYFYRTNSWFYHQSGIFDVVILLQFNVYIFWQKGRLYAKVQGKGSGLFYSIKKII